MREAKISVYHYELDEQGAQRPGFSAHQFGGAQLTGDTPEEAVFRCFVAARLGLLVDVPAEIASDPELASPEVQLPAQVSPDAAGLTPPNRISNLEEFLQAAEQSGMTAQGLAGALAGEPEFADCKDPQVQAQEAATLRGALPPQYRDLVIDTPQTAAEAWLNGHLLELAMMSRSWVSVGRARSGLATLAAMPPAARIEFAQKHLRPSSSQGQQRHAAGSLTMEAAQAIVHQRDYHAEHGTYDQTTYRPDADQCFDDWAADILEQAMRTDSLAEAGQRALPPAIGDLPDVELLTVARATGLRTYLHGVNATQSKAILRAYVNALGQRATELLQPGEPAEGENTPAPPAPRA